MAYLFANSKFENVQKFPLSHGIAQIGTLFITTMAIIDTLFTCMTKTAEIPYPLGPHIPI